MRQAEMYFFNMMQQLGLLKKAIFLHNVRTFLTGPTAASCQKSPFRLGASTFIKLN